MRMPALCLLLLASTAPALAQERPVPSDSARVTVSGCARGNAFVVRWRTDHESVAGEIAEGRRFRLTGPREVLGEVRKRQASMVLLTGLVRRNALAAPQGVSVGGVRIGIGPPQQPMSDPARTAGVPQPVLDVESYQALAEPCPSR